MPTYEYECESCGNRFEIFQSMKDPKLTDCPESACEGTVRRLLGTGAGVIFKGSGFYETDYRSESYKAAAKKESETSSSSSSGEGAKKESKTESSTSTSTPKKESKPASPSTSS